MITIIAQVTWDEALQPMFYMLGISAVIWVMK